MGDSEDKGKGLKTPPGVGQQTTPYRTPGAADAETERGFPTPSLEALKERYEILDELGRGGMGIVYRARDRETGEVVALKVLQPEIASRPDLIERFKAELRLARKITHKNVCRTYELLRFGDTVVISMEYVEGESLRHFLDRVGGVPLRRGLEWVEQICSALGEAHQQGVVHRDLKPENVLIARDGVAKVMDFGIARSLETGTNLTTGTETGAFIGTPAYMSPEQAEGKPADARSDIYSLGLLMYEMFTGRQAFHAETPLAMAVKHVHETPPPPREVEPLLPPSFDSAIRKCLEKNPKKRFPSAGEIPAALAQRAEATLPTLALEEKPVEVPLPLHLATWQRSDTYLLAGALVGLALFISQFHYFHPASALEITADQKQREHVPLEALGQMGWSGLADLKLDSPYRDPWFRTDIYYLLARPLGLRGVRNYFLSRSPGTWWDFWSATTEQGPQEGWSQTDIKGRLRSLTVGRGVITPRDFAHEQEVKPDLLARLEADPAAKARMQSRAQQAVADLLGLDVSGAPARIDVWVEAEEDRWGPSFSWRAQDRAGVWHHISVSMEGSTVISVGEALDNSRFPESDKALRRGAGPLFWRALVGAVVIGLFLFALFFLRRLYRQPRSAANLRLAVVAAAIIAAGAYLAWHAHIEERSTPGLWEGFELTMATLLGFVLGILVVYAALTTLLYYLRRSFPHLAKNYLDLLQRPFAARSAGLELLRGIFSGAAFTGLWIALILVTGWAGMAWLGAPFLLELSPFWHLAFPFIFLAEVLLLPCLLIIFPLTLLQRVSPRWPVLLALLAFLWLALGASMFGAFVVPPVPYHLFAMLQALWLGWVALRYGPLACVATAFTIEACLLAFPFFYVYQNLHPWTYGIPLLLWGLMLPAAAAIAFRPQLVGGWRRVAEVFE